MDFVNCYQSTTRAEAYSKLEFSNTYHLALRDLPEIFRVHVKGTSVAAGMVIPRPGEPSPTCNSLPFGVGDVENWNDTQADAPLFRGGPEVGMDYLTDYLGTVPLLILPRRLTGPLGVVPSGTLGPLQLHDVSQNRGLRRRRGYFPT
jgi:hypothetical protein